MYPMALLDVCKFSVLLADTELYIRTLYNVTEN